MSIRRLQSNGTWYRMYWYIGTAVAQWLRCCATNRKFVGSIPDCVIWIFHWHNPSDRTMALGSIQPLTEMSTRIISSEQRRPVRKAPPSCVSVMKSGIFNFLEPSGPLQACNMTALPFTITVGVYKWLNACTFYISWPMWMKFGIEFPPFNAFQYSWVSCEAVQWNVSIPLKAQLKFSLSFIHLFSDFEKQWMNWWSEINRMGSKRKVSQVFDDTSEKSTKWTTKQRMVELCTVTH